jgi:general secretion pathway protein A
MLLQYFGFQEEPFGATPDPRYLYPSETHREAMASLKYGFLSNRGFTAMIAPPGMGKTTLLF